MVAAVVLGATWWFGRSGDGPPTRYKMIVEVMTPTGMKVGTVVRGAQVRASPALLPIGESRPTVAFQGEALAVDIAPGQSLFVLFRGDDGDPDYAARIPDRLVESSTPLDIVNGVARSVELWPSKPDSIQYVGSSSVPLLVRFIDIFDPRSIRLVPKDDLASVFGQGVRLHRISVEATSEPVTKSLRRRLPWLDGLNGRLISNAVADERYSAMNGVTDSSFERFPI